MSESEPHITISCDGEGCYEEEEMQLTALAGGGWDDRYVEPKLERMGWVIDGDNHYCDECVQLANHKNKGDGGQ